VLIVFFLPQIKKQFVLQKLFSVCLYKNAKNHLYSVHYTHASILRLIFGMQHRAFSLQKTPCLHVKIIVFQRWYCIFQKKKQENN